MSEQLHTLIPLSNGGYALIDLDDLPLIQSYRWYRHYWKHHQWYAVTHIHKNGRVDGNLSMHRLILNPPVNRQVDHINRDSLDNRRCNLRAATAAQNQWNHPLRPNITRHRRWGTWRAFIGQSGEKRYIGSFKTREAAEAAYKDAARESRGEFYVDERDPKDSA